MSVDKIMSDTSKKARTLQKMKEISSQSFPNCARHLGVCAASPSEHPPRQHCDGRATSAASHHGCLNQKFNSVCGQ